MNSKKLALGIFQIICSLILGAICVNESVKSESFGAWLSMLLPGLLALYGFSNIKEANADSDDHS